MSDSNHGKNKIEHNHPHFVGIVDEITRAKESKDEGELFKFSRSSDPGIVLAVAQSEHSTPLILDSLAHHVSIVVLHAVACNPKTGDSTLERLSSHKDQLVRDYAKRNLYRRHLDSHQVELKRPKKLTF